MQKIELATKQIYLVSNMLPSIAYINKKVGERLKISTSNFHPSEFINLI